MPSPASRELDVAFHAIEQRRSHGVETLLRESIRHRTDMLVDAKNLLHHDQSAPGLTIWLGHIGIQFVTVARLQLHYFAHTHLLGRTRLSSASMPESGESGSRSMPEAELRRQTFTVEPACFSKCPVAGPGHHPGAQVAGESNIQQVQSRSVVGRAESSADSDCEHVWQPPARASSKPRSVVKGAYSPPLIRAICRATFLRIDWTAIIRGDEEISRTRGLAAILQIMQQQSLGGRKGDAQNQRVAGADLFHQPLARPHPGCHDRAFR